MTKIKDSDIIVTMHKQMNYMTMSARHVATGLIATQESYTQDKTMNQMLTAVKESLERQLNEIK